MSEFHVQVVRLGEIKPLENSDFLGITEVYGAGGYPCIVKRGDFKPGDLAVYIPVDSVVPDTAQFNFLAPAQKVPGADGANSRLPVGSVPERYRRIVAKRLRGTFSMGLLVPADEGMAEGDDVAAVLGIIKYEPPPIAFRTGPNTGGMDEQDPGLMPCYTDIAGLRRYPFALTEGEEVIITEKIHGENFRAVHDGERLWVGSRTRIKKEADDSRWWQAAKNLDLPSKLTDAPMMAVYGESHGYTGGFPYGVERNTAGLRLFDVMDTKSRRYLDYDDFVTFCTTHGLPIAPVLYRGPWSSDLRTLANGQSTIDPSHIREGIVIRPVRERFDPQLGRVILKLHGEEFLIKTGKGSCA